MSCWLTVRLVAPDGADDLLCTYEYAARWCEEHPGWSWRHVE